ncbi:hypothetical protein [Jannaschia sp. 2305UL9-9]|uniref:hypothetical protein n=1 Tax=Jannaschia sp. 2305UL9-9 TaxID=3121638 RepID=UPI003528CEDE
MLHRPHIEIVTEPTVGRLSGLCRVYAEGVAVAGGKARIWEVSETGALSAAAWSALSEADAVVFAPCHGGLTLSPAMQAFVVDGLLDPFGPDMSGKVASGLGNAPSLASISAAAIRLGMTWAEGPGRPVLTDRNIRHTAQTLVGLITESEFQAPPDRMAA